MICRLDSADIMFEGNGPNGAVSVGIEVKTIDDLLQSIGTGRLQATQIPAMVAAYDVRWLLYYGPWQEIASTGALQIQRGKTFHTCRIGEKLMPAEFLTSALWTVEAAGVRVAHVSTPQEAAKWVVSYCRWWSKPWKDHKGLEVFDTSSYRTQLPLTLDTDGATRDMMFRARIAAQLDGVGYRRATMAAAHFRSVLEMVTASVDQWAEVRGIGKVLARHIVEAIAKRGPLRTGGLAEDPKPRPRTNKDGATGGGGAAVGTKPETRQRYHGNHRRNQTGGKSRLPY
jgi:ERCC4-type nuclease